MGRQPSEARTVVTTYASPVDGLKSDLTKTSRDDIPPESSSRKQPGVAYFAAQMKALSDRSFFLIKVYLFCILAESQQRWGGNHNSGRGEIDEMRNNRGEEKKD